MGRGRRAAAGAGGADAGRGLSGPAALVGRRERGYCGIAIPCPTESSTVAIVATSSLDAFSREYV